MKPPKKVSGGLRYTVAVLEHFAKSGLTADHLRKLGVVEYGPQQNPELQWLKQTTASIPYTDADGNLTGFTRYRVFGDAVDADGKPFPKYTQGKGTGVHLYLPKLLPGGWRKVLSNASTPLLITEGEKKAVAGCLLGFATIAVAGVDCWASEGHPLPDWDLFVWSERPVVIAYDSDATQKRGVAKAAERLAAELRRRGADVRCASFPSSGDEKVGLDDFIQQDPTTAKARLDLVLRGAKATLK